MNCLNFVHISVGLPQEKYFIFKKYMVRFPPYKRKLRKLKVASISRHCFHVLRRFFLKL